MQSLRLTLAAAAACLLMVALDACGGSTASVVTVSAHPASATSSASTGLQQSFVEVIQRVAPAVVQISTPEGLGSGVVFDNRGDIVTNAHVVAGGGPFVVSNSRGNSYRATLVGSFVPDDIAVVRAEGASLRSATFASRALQVGDIVLAIGNPLGLRSSSPTESSAPWDAPSASPTASCSRT